MICTASVSRAVRPVSIRLTNRDPDDPADTGEGDLERNPALLTMTLKLDPTADDVPRTEQFEKFQALAITSQSIPVCRDLLGRLENAGYAAEQTGTTDFEELAALLAQASDEFDELAEIAESVAEQRP